MTGYAPLDKIVSHTFPLEKINGAFAQSEWLGRQPGEAAITRAAIARRCENRENGEAAESASAASKSFALFAYD